MSDWIQCPSCDEELRVVSDTGLKIEYCPFCGGDIIEEDSLDDEDEWE